MHHDGELHPSVVEPIMGSANSDLAGLSAFGFRVSGFEFWVSGFGFRVSGFRFRVLGVGFQIWRG